MEIDFSETSLNVTLILSAVTVILGLFLLGMLGNFVFPDQVLSWNEWQIMGQRAAYQREVLILQRTADNLTAMINQDEIEPIRAQIVGEQIAKNLEAVSLPPLDDPRQALLAAAQALIDWSLGYPKAPAVDVLGQANQLVLRASR